MECWLPQHRPYKCNISELCGTMVELSLHEYGFNICCYSHSISLSHYWDYSDVIMSIMVFQITSILIVYSTICSGADQRKHQSSVSLAFVRRIHWEDPSQRANNTENVSVSWHHHVALKGLFHCWLSFWIITCLAASHYLNQWCNQLEL